MKISVIIPSLNPDEKLICVVDSLIGEGFDDIILVNDGSDKEHMWPFEKLSSYSQCTILTHEVNKGKGRGLKTAFEFCMNNRRDCDGVVTVDGDNQHKANDIYNCCRAMVESDKVILGVRDFSGKDVPFKSSFGNNMTSFVFKLLCGLKISDTQTGLRAIPFKYLEDFCQVEGERFEYETNMLLEFNRKSIPFDQVPIETVYIEENASTHFNPIKDSIKIYKVILKYVFKKTSWKYTLSSLASWVIDNALFNILEFIFAAMTLSLRLLLCTGVARVLSSIFNFAVNRNIVFKSDKNIKTTIVKYYILWVCQLMASYGLVYLVSNVLSLGYVLIAVAKIVIDLGLFVISYNIQKKWVFK
ncbi:MAG: bifunctional glycosyltransferase family 2/GtrA family protein [Eubacteriales bacterium]|nr:bifunctional glycosyltransferase family 2/GtrA family protein [Eubacteriales bacterium]